MRPQDRLSGMFYDEASSVNFSDTDVQQEPADYDNSDIKRSAILGQLTRAQEKLSARWSAIYGAIPVTELRGILSNDLGYNAEEIRRDIAERAIVLWVNKNELRMKRELRNLPKL